MLKHGLYGKITRLFLILLFYTSYLFSNNLLLDDFNDGIDPNYLGGNSGSWSANGGEFYIEYIKSGNVYGNNGYSLQIEFNVSTPGSYGGCWLGLNSADISSYKFLTFRVKGKIGAENFRIGMKDIYGNEYWIPINDYLISGVNQRWQKVVIPFSAFKNVNKSAMDNITFYFEYPAGRGLVYIDDILFRQNSSLIWVDTFDSGEDNYNSVGGFSGTWGDWCTKTFYNQDPENIYGEVGYSLKLRYDNTSSSFPGYFTTLESIDISDTDTVVFFAKFPVGNEQIEVGLKDTSLNESKIPITNIQTNLWQRFEMNITSFTQPNFSAMDNFSITFTSINTGSIYIDEIYFNDISAPTAPSQLKADDVSINDGFSVSGRVKLSAIADSETTDPTMEGVRFEYSTDGMNWYIIDTDFDISDNIYEGYWNTVGLDESHDYKIRAVAFDCADNTSAGTIFSSGSVVKSVVTVYPNPFYPGNGKSVKFLNIPNESIIRIYTISGELVYTLEEEDNDGIAAWYGKNESDNFVISGVYLFYIEKEQEVYDSGKFVIINK